MDVANSGSESRGGVDRSQVGGSGGQRIDVVFIVGVAYCGSTLLSFVLNTHPQILSVGEVGATEVSESEDYLCSCGVKLVECPFFLKVKECMARRGVQHDLLHWNLRHRYSESGFWNRLAEAVPPGSTLLTVRNGIRDLLPHCRQRIRDYARRNHAFMSAALEAANKRVFLDATKHPGRIPLLTKMEANLKIIHLVRDPRGYCYSVRRHRPQSKEVPGRDWVGVNRLTEYYLRRLPSSQWRRVRYEAICSDPDTALRELTDFMGVEPFVLPENFREYPNHVIGNAMRLSSDGRVTIQLDEKWREALTASDRDTVSRLAGPLGRTYGYDL